MPFVYRCRCGGVVVVCLDVDVYISFDMSYDNSFSNLSPLLPHRQDRVL